MSAIIQIDGDNFGDADEKTVIGDGDHDDGDDVGRERGNDVETFGQMQIWQIGQWAPIRLIFRYDDGDDGGGDDDGDDHD